MKSRLRVIGAIVYLDAVPNAGWDAHSTHSAGTEGGERGPAAPLVKTDVIPRPVALPRVPMESPSWRAHRGVQREVACAEEGLDDKGRLRRTVVLEIRTFFRRTRVA